MSTLQVKMKYSTEELKMCIEIASQKEKNKSRWLYKTIPVYNREFWIALRACIVRLFSTSNEQILPHEEEHA